MKDEGANIKYIVYYDLIKKLYLRHGINIKSDIKDLMFEQIVVPIFHPIENNS